MRAKHPIVFALIGMSLGLAWAGTRAAAQLALEIDPLGQAFLANESSAELEFTGYLIVSNKGLLSPTNWSSIADQVQANPGHVASALGSGSLTFGEANPGAKSLAELNIAESGVLAGGAQFSIGYPFAKTVGPASGLEFSYISPGMSVGVDGAIRFLEPDLGDALRLLVAPDGAAWLENLGKAPVAFDGYQLTDENGNLNPAGWMSISDYVGAGRGGEIAALLGDGGLEFREANPGAGNLAELTKSGQGVLQPGAKFALGFPFQPGEDWSTANFNYRLQGASLSQRGEIVTTPEPAAWLLATLGVIGCLTMRRRTTR